MVLIPLLFIAPEMRLNLTNKPLADEPRNGCLNRRATNPGALRELR